jgi:hypothetical protein
MSGPSLVDVSEPYFSRSPAGRATVSDGYSAPIR